MHTLPVYVVCWTWLAWNYANVIKCDNSLVRDGLHLTNKVMSKVMVVQLKLRTLLVLNYGKRWARQTLHSNLRTTLCSAGATACRSITPPAIVVPSAPSATSLHQSFNQRDYGRNMLHIHITAHGNVDSFISWASARVSLGLAPVSPSC